MNWWFLAASIATEEREASPENGSLFPVPTAAGGHALLSQCSEYIKYGFLVLMFTAQPAILLRVKAVVEFNVITLTGHMVTTKY